MGHVERHLFVLFRTLLVLRRWLVVFTGIDFVYFMSSIKDGCTVHSSKSANCSEMIIYFISMHRADWLHPTILCLGIQDVNKRVNFLSCVHYLPGIVWKNVSFKVSKGFLVRETLQLGSLC